MRPVTTADLPTNAGHLLSCRETVGRLNSGVDATVRAAAPSAWTSVRNHSPTGPSWGYGGSGSAQLALGFLLSVTAEAMVQRFYQRFKWSVIATIEAGPLDAGRRRHSRLAGVGCGNGRLCGLGAGGAVIARRLLGARLPATTHAGKRQVEQVLRKILFRYRLHHDQELFDPAYGYIRQYY